MKGPVPGWIVKDVARRRGYEAPRVLLDAVFAGTKDVVGKRELIDAMERVFIKHESCDSGILSRRVG